MAAQRPHHAGTRRALAPGRLCERGALNPPDPILCAWDYAAPEDGDPAALQAWIPPDGCQDWIGVRMPDGRVDWHLFTLAHRAETAQLQPGTAMRGYRLRPGVQIDQALLARIGAADTLEDEEDIRARLLEATHCDARVQDALTALAHTPSVRQAARELGVGVRTLERLLRSATHHPPQFWRSLARMRQTCHSLASTMALAEVAALHGYADQSHMNLSFQHWLGCTPRQLRAHPERLALLGAEGYA